MLTLLLWGSSLASILGAAAFFDWAFSSEDDDSDTPSDEVETGIDLAFDGSETLTGTEGDDVLPTGQDADLAPDEIYLLGGNDTAHVENVFDELSVYGGEGDDSLSANGVYNILDGGAGNDVLSGDDANDLYGGVGDDVLNFTHGSYNNDYSGKADGGEGNDILNIRADALAPDLTNDVGGVRATGGQGSDEFNVVYELKENFDGGGHVISGGDWLYDGKFVNILDFNPAEDELRVEIERNAGTEDRDITVDLEQTQQEDGTFKSEIKMTFAATAEQAESYNTLFVTSTAAFTLDDVVFVGI